MKKDNNLLAAAAIVIPVCLVFAVMQGVHDNYGIMLKGIMGVTGLSYSAVSFVIGVGALLYGVAQPFMGMLALKRSNAFVMQVGIALIVIGLVATPFCRSFSPLLLFFGIVLPVGTTGLASGILIGFGTCGFNMSIIESHLFSQYVSYGIPGATASLTLTVYGIMTMLGAIATGALSSRFKMKNILGTTYLIRVFISLAFLFLPKSVPFAFIMTGLLGASGDSTVPTTMGTINRKFGARKIGVLYGFALVGHQIGAFASASLGGVFVDHGMGYAPLWIVTMCWMMS